MERYGHVGAEAVEPLVEPFLLAISVQSALLHQGDTTQFGGVSPRNVGTSVSAQEPMSPGVARCMPTSPHQVVLISSSQSVRMAEQSLSRAH